MRRGCIDATARGLTLGERKCRRGSPPRMTLGLILYRAFVAYYRKMAEKRNRGGAGPVLAEVCKHEGSQSACRPRGRYTKHNDKTSRKMCANTSHVLTAGKMHRLHPHQCTRTCTVACNSHAASCPLIPLLCVHQSDALFRALQLIYMGVSIAASAWVMRWLISAFDPEKENKNRVSPITICL